MYKILYSHTKRHTTKYKYAVNVQKNVKEAINFDQLNGNTLYPDVIGT